MTASADPTSEFDACRAKGWEHGGGGLSPAQMLVHFPISAPLPLSAGHPSSQWHVSFGGAFRYDDRLTTVDTPDKVKNAHSEVFLLVVGNKVHAKINVV